MIYSNSLKGEFLFDDWYNIVDNPNIRLTQLNLESIDKVGGYYPEATRPVAYISFALNYYFHRLDVLGYHLVNVFIHIITGIFLYLFIKTTLGLPALRNRYQSYRWLPMIAVLIWLVHPIQTQSVSYIVQRMTSMAAMFYILSLYLYARGRVEERLKRKWLCYSGCAVAGLLSLGSKENAATLPVFIFLYEWFFVQDLSGAWIKRRLPLLFGVVVFIIAVIVIFLGADPVDTILKGYANRDFSMGERVLTELRIVIFYLTLLIYPNPSRLNLTHDFPLSTTLLDPVTTLFSLIAITGMIGLAIYMAKRERLLSYCVLWFFGNLLIESSVISLELVFEHRLYLPSMLALLLFVILGYRFLKPQWLGLTATCAVVLLLSLWTYQRNDVWRDRLSMWTDCVNKSPRLARPQNNLASALIDSGRIEEGLNACKLAQEKDPHYLESYGTCGAGLLLLGKTDQAIEQFATLLRFQPDNWIAHNNMASALLKTGKIEQAITHSRYALEINPLYDKAHLTWGYGLFSRGEIDGAIGQYRQALRINPASEEGHNNMAEALIEKGQLEEGIEHCRMALKISPEFADAHGTWGNALYRLGKYDEAIDHFREALRLNPANVSAHNNLGAVFLKIGETEQAISQFQAALQINPEHASARNNLRVAEEKRSEQQEDDKHTDPDYYFEQGNQFKAQGRFTEAIEQYQKALAIAPGAMAVLNELASLYYNQQDYDNALALYTKMTEYQPGHYIPYYNIACIYAKQNKLEESLHWLKGAVERGFNDKAFLKSDPDLENIRETDYFKQLIAQ